MGVGYSAPRANEREENSRQELDPHSENDSEWEREKFRPA